jgi:ubiquinol-cytochrome c reductase iron-sulfur subunit
MSEPAVGAAPPPQPKPSRRPPTTRLPAAAFLLSIIAALALAIVYWQGGQPQAEGILLSVALGGIGVGVIAWAHRFLPPGPDVEERPLTASSDEELERLDRELIGSEEEIGRRRVLVRLFGAALGALGLAALFPLRSLGPRPGRGLRTSPFTSGDHLVTEQGERVRPGDIAADGVITVFPEHKVSDADASTLLIHLRPGQNRPRPGRDDWSVDQLVAYSKICTHAGCPVGLYQAQRGLLLCPCHQSTFEVADGCRPVFGPAARSLPQLPLDTDDGGYLIAGGPFSGPVGPAFWDQLR